MSIKTKIAGTVFVLVASLMVLLTWASYRYLVHTFKESISRQHATVLAIAARHVDDEVLRSQEILGLIAKAIDPARLSDSDAVQKRLDEVVSTRPFFDAGLTVVDAEARIVAENPATANRRGKSVKAGPYAAITLASGVPYISAPYISGLVPDDPVITFTAPILRADGSVAGLLAGRHNLLEQNGLSDLGKMTIGTRGRIILIDRNRTVIMHPEHSRIMRRVAPGEDPGLDDAIQRNTTAYGEKTDAKGSVWITAAQPLTRADWLVAVQYPESEAYAPLKEARFVFAIGLALLLGLTHLALFFLVRQITDPLIRLTGHVRALPTKEGRARLIKLGTGDEVEQLALAVNEMVGEMDQKREVLEENRELYRLIANFTSELALLENNDGSIRYISANCLALTGYSDREFLKQPQLLEQIVHPEDLELWRNRKCGTQAEPGGGSLKLRLVSRKGEERWFDYSCHEVTGAKAEHLGVRGSFRDISKDRLLEKKLEEQHEFAQSLLENTSMPLFVIDMSHRVIIWNRAIAELTGIPAQKMVGSDCHSLAFYPEKRRTLSDLVMDGDMEQIATYYRDFHHDPVLQGIVRAEGWYENLNGKDRYLFFDAAPVVRDGQMVAVVETLYDITERARAEESLRLFSQAVEQSASSIVITGADGTIEFVNRKFSEVTGYAAQEAIGQKPSLLKSGKQPQELYRELWETVSAGHEWQGEFHNRRKNGTLFWESALISPILDQNGKVTHFLGIKEDISSRKDAERQLLKNQAEMVLKHEQLSNLFRQVEKSKREWEQTMDCIDDMVAMVDGEGRVRRCNRAFAKFAARSYPQLLSAQWSELLRGVGLDPNLLEGVSGELYHEPSQRWFTVKAYPYGDGSGEVIMLHDLTEIKQVSEQLSAAYQELKATHSQLLQQEKMASIGQLAAGVAHEINNPMGFISSNLGTMLKYLERLEGFLELQSAAVEEVAPDDLKQEMVLARRKFKVDYIMGDARSLLAESQDGAERVRTIVQNLKSFSRVDDAQANYVDLNDCLESTVTIAWNELKYKTTLKRDYGELPAVKCLPQQLNQVFLNILVNAAHAIEKQGEVTISTRQEGEQVAISIHDTGSGIPPEIRDRIFEPFFTTKEVGKGTGLGLSISYDIIKKHNGSIEVESSAETGTTFTIKLPIEGV
jgi:two-component system, NtrC family, sensor kinase